MNFSAALWPIISFGKDRPSTKEPIALMWVPGSHLHVQSEQSTWRHEQPEQPRTWLTSSSANIFYDNAYNPTKKKVSTTTYVDGKEYVEVFGQTGERGGLEDYKDVVFVAERDSFMGGRSSSSPREVFSI